MELHPAWRNAEDRRSWVEAFGETSARRLEEDFDMEPKRVGDNVAEELQAFNAERRSDERWMRS